MKTGDDRILLVTDPRPDLVDRVEAVVRGGVDIVQLRDKHSSRGTRPRSPRWSRGPRLRART